MRKIKVLLLEDDIPDVEKSCRTFRNYVDLCDFYLISICEKGGDDHNDILDHINNIKKRQDLNVFGSNIKIFDFPESPMHTNYKKKSEEKLKQLINYIIEENFDLRLYDRLMKPFFNWYPTNNTTGEERKSCLSGADIMTLVCIREYKKGIELKEDLFYSHAENLRENELSNPLVSLITDLALATTQYPELHSKLMSRFTQDRILVKSKEEFPVRFKEALEKIIHNKITLIKLLSELFNPFKYLPSYPEFKAYLRLRNQKYDELINNNKEKYGFRSITHTPFDLSEEKKKIVEYSLEDIKNYISNFLDLDHKETWEKLRTFRDNFYQAQDDNERFKLANEIKIKFKLGKKNIEQDPKTDWRTLINEAISDKNENIFDLNGIETFNYVPNFYCDTEVIKRGISKIFDSIVERTDGKISIILKGPEESDIKNKRLFVKLVIKYEGKFNIKTTTQDLPGTTLNECRRIFQPYALWRVRAKFEDGSKDINFYNFKEINKINLGDDIVTFELKFNLPFSYQ